MTPMLLLLALVRPALAAPSVTVGVSGEYAQIADALGAVDSDGEILLLDDVGVQVPITVDDNAQGITIKPDPAAGAVVWVSDASAPVVWGLESAHLIIEDLTIDCNGGAGISMGEVPPSGAPPQLELNQVTMRDCVRESGASVRADEGALVTIRGGRFENGVASTFGGHLRIIDGAHLEQTGATVFDTGQVSGGAGGTGFIASATASFDGARFSAGFANGGAGHLVIASGSVVDLVNTTFDVGDADDGGHLFIEGSTVDIVNSSFADGSAASGDGGSIYVVGSTVLVQNTSFSSSMANGRGGAIAAVDSDLTIELGSSFISPTASSWGGAVYAATTTGPTSLTVTDTTISSPSGGEFGDAIYAPLVTERLTLTDVTITDDVRGPPVIMGSGSLAMTRVALNGTAGVSWQTTVGTSTVDIDDCDFIDAQSSLNKSVELNMGGFAVAATITDSDFSKVGAPVLNGNGGCIGVQNSTGELLVAGSTFTGCATQGNGGAIWAQNAGKLSVTNSVFDGCDSGTQGGGIYALNTEVAVTGSRFTGNGASFGGAFWVSSPNLGEPFSMVGTILDGNTANNGAGGIVNARDGITFDDNRVCSNVATNFTSGVLLADSGGAQTLNVRRNLFFDNDGGNNGGALRLDKDSNDTVAWNVEHNTFVHNEIGGGSGAAMWIKYDNGQPIVRDNLVALTTGLDAVHGETILTIDNNGMYSNAFDSSGTVTEANPVAVTTLGLAQGPDLTTAACEGPWWPVPGSDLRGAASDGSDLGAFQGGPGAWDMDGDGEDSIAAGGGDCDDDDASVNPGAVEVCDGVDNNCDNVVDLDAVDALSLWADDDGDGFGDPADPFVSCAQPPSSATNNQDCDDTSFAIKPGAEEVCDGADNDCDGTTDVGASDASLWYGDGDDDGYGNAAVSVSECSPPAGFVADATDCDDSEADRHPNNTEVCDGIDNDCVGAPDDGAVDMSTWFKDGDGDGFGDEEHPGVNACTVPFGHVADRTDCDDDQATVNPDHPELCDGLDNDCDGTADPNDATDARAWFVDSDGDGFGAGDALFTCANPVGRVDNDQDCDDGEAAVYPGAPEVCDELDNDCNGRTDEDPTTWTTWYTDADQDGFGVGPGEDACFGDGRATVGGDCDDSRADVNPDAAEVVGDGVDNDCGGGEATDGDGDGYHHPDWGGNDCDDADASVHPWAEEIPGDGIDQDCDGFDDVDADGDGHLASDDCDDADAGVFPGADEPVGSGVDRDCDGVWVSTVVGGSGCGCTSGGGDGGPWPAVVGMLLVCTLRRRRC